MTVKRFPLVTWNLIQCIWMKRGYQQRVSYNHSLTSFSVSLRSSPVRRSVGPQYHLDPGHLLLLHLPEHLIVDLGTYGPGLVQYRVSRNMGLWRGHQARAFPSKLLAPWVEDVGEDGGHDLLRECARNISWYNLASVKSRSLSPTPRKKCK